MSLSTPVFLLGPRLERQEAERQKREEQKKATEVPHARGNDPSSILKSAGTGP